MRRARRTAACSLARRLSSAGMQAPAARRAGPSRSSRTGVRRALAGRTSAHAGQARSSVRRPADRCPTARRRCSRVQPSGACVFFERGSRQPVRASIASSAPNRCRSPAGSFPRVVLRRRARNAHLAFALLPDRGSACSHRRRQPRSRSCERRRRSRSTATSRASTRATRCRRSSAGHADRSRRLRCVGTARRSACSRERRPDRRAERSTSSRHATAARAGLAAGCASACAPRSTASSTLRPRRKPDEDLDGIAAARLAARGRSVPDGPPCPRPLDGDVARGVAEHRAMVAGESIGAVRGYLAARLFGNWVAYYGQGLHAIVEYLQVCPGRREDGSRAARTRRKRRHHHGRPSPKPFETPISCSCTCRTQRTLARRLG